MIRAKYHNRKTEVDGITFASAAEAKRYCELKLLAKAGKISDLKLQPRYPLVVAGKKIATYVADFEYHEDGRLVCEDVKGLATPVFKLKRKLFEACYPGRTIDVVAAE